MRTNRYGMLLLLSVALAACARNGDEAVERPAADGLTAEQLEKGLGPITSLPVGEVDEGLAERGEQIFAMKCAACHQLDARYVGPPLRDVTARRTPEFIMNMMLNPAEMLERHPTARQLLAEYYTPMPMQNLTTDEARALLEYLRYEHAESGKSDHHPGGDS